MKTWTRAAAVVAVGLLASAASAAELRVGYSADITTLDPANHRSRVTEGVILNMHDALLARTDDMKVVPELAESCVNRRPGMTPNRQGVNSCSAMFSLTCTRAQGVNLTPIGGHLPMPIHTPPSAHRAKSYLPRHFCSGATRLPGRFSEGFSLRRLHESLRTELGCYSACNFDPLSGGIGVQF
jgi:hypothetical protein